MIKSFGDAETEKIWNQQRSRRLPGNIQQRALNKLAMLNNALDITPTFASLRQTVLKHCLAIGQGSIVFALTSNGASASDGKQATH